MEDTFNTELTAEKYARDYFQNKNLQRPSEEMALNYEIVKDKSFPYDDYTKNFTVEAFPTDYPLSFLRKLFKIKKMIFIMPEIKVKLQQELEQDKNFMMII